MRCCGSTLAAIRWSIEKCQNGAGIVACKIRASDDLPELDAPLSRMILPGATRAGASFEVAALEMGGIVERPKVLFRGRPRRIHQRALCRRPVRSNIGLDSFSLSRFDLHFADPQVRVGRRQAVTPAVLEACAGAGRNASGQTLNRSTFETSGRIKGTTTGRARILFRVSCVRVMNNPSR